jgi:hypothetical protein
MSNSRQRQVEQDSTRGLRQRASWLFPLNRPVLKVSADVNHSFIYKILCFHGGHYEEFRLLGYEPLVRTPQETQ